MRGLDARDDRVHSLLGLRYRRVFLEPAHDLQPVIPTVTALLLAFGNDVGHPHLAGLGSTHRILKAFRHHADDFPHAAVKRHGFAQHVWRAAEAALPQRVADDSNLVVAIDFLVGCVSAADSRRDPQEAEQVCRGARHTEHFRVAALAKCEPPAASDCGESFERTLRARCTKPVQIILRGGVTALEPVWSRVDIGH